MSQPALDHRYDGPWPVDPFRARPLRRQVLRPNQPEEASDYPGDADYLAVHLGVFHDGAVVAAGSLFPEEGWRIRGMATLPEHRGEGLGRAVLEGLLEAAAARGGGRVWCNARTTVTDFYARFGFVPEGGEFEIEGIGPHLTVATEVPSSVAAGGFDLDEAVALLTRTPQVLRSWIGGLPDSIVDTPEGPGLWSLRDLVGHYVHGEGSEWITRVEHILGPNREEPFRPFERFAMYRRYADRELHDLLDEFVELREAALMRLDELAITEEMLDREGRHPVFGEVRLRQLLSAWICHDLSHLAQAARIMARKIAPDVGPWHRFIRIVRD